jgi:hypothetical protein
MENKARTITAYAIVSKTKPKLSIQDIYNKDQIQDIQLEKSEIIIKVEIKEIK